MENEMLGLLGVLQSALSSLFKNQFWLRLAAPARPKMRLIRASGSLYCIGALLALLVGLGLSIDAYGENGELEFKKQSDLRDVCVYNYYKAAGEKEHNYTNVLNDTAVKTQVLVCFCDGDTVRDILKAIRQMNMTGKFTLIASDRWAERDDVLSGYESEAEGNFFIDIVMPASDDTTQKIEYAALKNMSQSFSENKWMFDLETYRSSKNCSDSNTQCGEPLLDSKLPFVKKSIDLIHDLTKTKHSCQPEETPREDFNSRYLNEDLRFAYRQPRSTFYDIDLWNFESDGNPKNSLRSYRVSNYKKVDGAFKLEPVGTWINGELKDTKELQLPVPKFNTLCRNDCKRGQHFETAEQLLQTKLNDAVVILLYGMLYANRWRRYLRNRNFVNNRTCCWDCINCEYNNYTLIERAHACNECDPVLKANSNQTGCEPKEEDRIYWYEVDALICIIVSTFGILATLASAFIFYEHIDVPIIKYSSPKLTLITFCGMILAYSYAFLLVMRPSAIVCTLIKFCTSVSLTMIYGPLLTRTNRTSRAFTITKLREPSLKWKYFSTEFLMKIFLYFLAGELLMIAVVDYFAFRLKDLVFLDTSDFIIMKVFCERDEINQFNSRQLVNVLLLVYTCVFAFKTMKLPDNFYESKFIASFCVFTIVTWIIYVLIFLSTNTPRTAQISLCLVLSASAFSCLAGFIFPKLYVILWPMEKHNTGIREDITGQLNLAKNLANKDSLVAKDMSLWVHLGVASRITPDIIDESELKSTGETSEQRSTNETIELKSTSEA